MPVLFYQQNGGRTYTGGSMTDRSTMTSFSMSLDGIIDGSVSYSATGASLAASSGSDGSAVRGDSIYTLKLALEGNVANYYSLKYRVYSNGAWSSWKSEGTLAGNRGYAIERVQARLEEKAAVVFGTVSFDAEGVDSISAVVGNTVKLPALPDGYEGWYADSSCSASPITEVVAAEGVTTVYGKKAVTVIIPGDLDGDGYTTAMDINIGKRLVAGSVTATEMQLAAGDLNSDGMFNGIDLNMLVRDVSGVN